MPTSKLKQKRLQAFIDALRSGKYKQGRSRLVTQLFEADEPRYCCIGVLCDIYAKRTKKGKWVRNDVVAYPKFEVNGKRAGSRAPEEVLGYFGITGKQESTAIKMNDKQDRGFTTIAGYFQRILNKATNETK